MIAIPEIYRDNAIGTCVILERGNKCHPALQANTWVMIEHTPESKRIIVDKETKDFLIDESKIIGVIYRDRKLRPLGDTILFQRDLKVQTESGIYLTPNVTQNLEGWVRGIGILRYGHKKRKAEININSRCCLTRWEETMKEFYYNEGIHIVAESKDVLFQWEE